MMTKRLRVLAVLATLAMLAAACSSGGSDDGPSSAPGASPGEPSGTLRLFSYSDGFDPAYMTTFYEQYPDIDLETASFGSNDEAIAKLQAGFQADVINSCVDEATLEMVNKGLYAPLDVSRLENWDDIWPSMKALPGVQVDGEVYLVPCGRGHGGDPVQRGRRHDASHLMARPVRPAVGRAGVDGRHLRHRDRHRGIGERDLRSIDDGLGSARPGQELPDRPPRSVPDVLEGRGRHQVAVQVRRGRDRVRVPGLREAAPQGRGQRAVRRREGRPDAVDVRLRHQSRMPRTSMPRTRCSTGIRACPRRSTRRRNSTTSRRT